MSGRIRVLEFVTMLEVGGTETQLLHLVERIDRRRFDVAVACLRRSGPLVEQVEARGTAVRTFDVHRLWGLGAMAQQVRFAADLRRSAVDVVHTLGFYPNVFALLPARLSGRATVGSVREQPTMWTPAQRRANRLALSFADRVVVNARTVGRSLVASGLPEEKVRLVPNGVDVDRFEAARPSRPLRAELGWPEDAPIVAVVSRLSPGKGVDLFVEAAAEVARMRPAARFVVVGDGGEVKDGAIVWGEHRARLERRAQGLGLAGRLSFTGQRLDVPEILADVQVSVVPSPSEALSNSLLESMAAGVPLVASAVGDHATVVADGQTGLLVPPSSRDAMVRGIVRLLDDEALAVRLGGAARKFVRERFSIERMVRKTEAVYEEIVGRARSVPATTQPCAA